MTSTTPSLLWQRSGQLLRLTLNRVKALNSLDTDMCADIRKNLVEWRATGSNDVTTCPPAVFMVKGAGGKAFCAGGDVKTIWQSLVKESTGVQTTTNTEAVKFFSNEYEMNYLLGTSPVPQVSIWDGIVMGGGVGLSVLGDFRVATEKTLFAMPECAIGIFPDVGASWWLTRLPVWQPMVPPSNTNSMVGVPAGFDLFVGMTGFRLNTVDLVTTGIATHFVSCNYLEDMEQELIARCPVGNIATRNHEARQLVRSILDNYQERSHSSLASLPPSTLIPHYQSIQNTFAGKSSVTEIYAALTSEYDEDSDKGQWAKNTMAVLRKQSPTSLALTFEQLRRGRRLLSLKDCLRMEYRLMLNCIGGGSSSVNEKQRRKYGDFLEGIRAVLVDKDNKPIWHPSTIDAVDMNHVTGCFDAIPEGELNLDQYAKQ